MFTLDPQAPLSIAARSFDRVIVLEITGEVDLDTAPELARALDIRGGDVDRVVVDLTAVTFLDSSGLRALVEAWRRLAVLEIALRVVVPTPSIVRRVFELTDLVETLGIVASLEDALSA